MAFCQTPNYRNNRENKHQKYLSLWTFLFLLESLISYFSFFFFPLFSLLIFSVLIDKFIIHSEIFFSSFFLFCRECFCCNVLFVCCWSGHHLSLNNKCIFNILSFLLWYWIYGRNRPFLSPVLLWYLWNDSPSPIASIRFLNLKIIFCV